MNSLEELNNLANTSISFNDGRAAGLLLTNTTPVNGNVSITEGSNSTVYLGTDIRAIINQTTGVYYTITTPSVANISLNWPALPANVNFVNSSAYISRVGPIFSTRQWNQIKQPYLSFSRDYAPHTFTYTSQLQFGNANANSVSWVTTATIVDTPEISEAADFVYNKGATVTVAGYPLVVDTNAQASDNYVLTLNGYGNVFTLPGTFSSTSNSNIGGNSSYSSNILTISGNLAQVNSHLANIRYTTASTVDSDYTAQYRLNNPVSNLLTTVYQYFEVNSSIVLSRTTRQQGFFEDTNVTLANVPTFIDSHNAGTGSYTMVITATTDTGANATSNYTTSGTGTVTTSLAANTQQVTLTGTRANLNSHLGNLVITPYVDYDQNFNLSFLGTTQASEVARRTKLMVCAGTNVETGNLNVSRSMFRNTPGLLFTNTAPQIIESVNGSPTYSVTISGGPGQFRQSANTYVGSATFTGNKAEVNAWLPTLTYYPTRDFRGSGLLNYVQTRSNVTQMSVQFGLDIVTNIAPIAEQTTYTFYANAGSSFTFTPSEFQVRYLNCNLYVGGTVGNAGGGQISNISIPYNNYGILMAKADTSGRLYNLIYTKNDYGTSVISTEVANKWKLATFTTSTTAGAYPFMWSAQYGNLQVAQPDGTGTRTWWDWGIGPYTTNPFYPYTTTPVPRLNGPSLIGSRISDGAAFSNVAYLNANNTPSVANGVIISFKDNPL